MVFVFQYPDSPTSTRGCITCCMYIRVALPPHRVPRGGDLCVVNLIVLKGATPPPSGRALDIIVSIVCDPLSHGSGGCCGRRPWRSVGRAGLVFAGRTAVTGERLFREGSGCSRQQLSERDRDSAETCHICIVRVFPATTLIVSVDTYVRVAVVTRSAVPAGFCGADNRSGQATLPGPGQWGQSGVGWGGRARRATVSETTDSFAWLSHRSRCQFFAHIIGCRHNYQHRCGWFCS